MTFLERLDMLKSRNQIKTNHALSKATGIPYTTIDGWYKRGGVTGINLSTLETLASFFDVSIDFLVRDTQNETEKASTPGEPDAETIDLYNALNNLLVVHGLIGPDEDITEQQAAILSSVISILNATFKN